MQLSTNASFASLADFPACFLHACIWRQQRLPQPASLPYLPCLPYLPYLPNLHLHLHLHLHLPGQTMSSQPPLVQACLLLYHSCHH